MENDSTALHTMLFFLFTGFFLMGIGFNFRESRWGLTALALGSVTMLSTIGYRIYMALN